MAVAATVGLLPNGPAYITGTGAHDRITITRASANHATVMVEAFNNAAMQPGQLIGTPFIYTVDTGNGLLIEAGVGDDQMFVDADIGRNITVRGGGGTDVIQINGTGTFAPTGAFTNVTYTATGTGAGIVAFDGFQVSFSEVEPLRWSTAPVRQEVPGSCSTGMH